ncbi:tetratricopeptide repeat protein [Rhodohalobacter sp.]|uniref:tetratricopeptide repeat protein n=1 Tax=Rhodohalobacter sp. TaxID=1974210 RepID=UPI002ACE968C|nr:tetratricopeptide repeat protein [Rhodohalobacter sp.]MDZ7756876.1 tetratricopeptide repeat protein [Rhodohalobacter sp.]
MKSLKLILILAAAFSVTLFAVEQTNAQDARGEAIQLYNQAQELAGSGDFTNSIALYRDALEISQANDLNDITELIVERIPRVASSRASDAYRGYQSERTVESVNNALSAFQEAKEVAEEFGNAEVRQQAEGALPQLYYIRSVLHFRAENYENALADLDTAIEMNSNYALAYYQKALVTKNQLPSEVDTWLGLYDEAIEVARRVNDERALQNSLNSAREELIYRAVNLSEDRQFDRALNLLQKVEQYDPQSEDAEYRMAEIYNKRGQWNQALQHATRALEYESGGVDDKAKIYYELGTAYKGQGQKENACDAFENARYGDFTEPANHELQFELKCEGHTPTGR